MDLFLQVWGGLFYLLAKVFLAHAEGEESSKWRIPGWFVYLYGIPPWVLILAEEHNWIAMTIEVGAAPAMILGIIFAKKGREDIPPLLDNLTKVFVYGLIIAGFGYSIYEFGGINSFSQILECGITAGSLVGTYLLSKKDGQGWLWFVLMNVSMGTLMGMQEKWILVLLQVVSLYFAISGYRRSRRRNGKR